MATPQEIIDDAREYVDKLAYSAEQALNLAGQRAELAVASAIINYFLPKILCIIIIYTKYIH